MYNNLDSQFNSTILNPEYNKYPICYMTKQCEENNKLWSRNEPLDDIQKNSSWPKTWVNFKISLMDLNQNINLNFLKNGKLDKA